MQYYAKAVYAGVVYLIGSLTAALVALGDGAGLGDLTTTAWLIILGGTVAAIGGVLGLQKAPASVSTSVH